MAHEVCLVVAAGEYGQVDTTFSLLLDQFYQCTLIAGADVEVTVGSQDDTVVTVFDEVVGGYF